MKDDRGGARFEKQCRPFKRALASANDQVAFVFGVAEIDVVARVLKTTGGKLCFQIFGDVCEVSEAGREYDVLCVDGVAVYRRGDEVIVCRSRRCI